MILMGSRVRSQADPPVKKVMKPEIRKLCRIVFMVHKGHTGMEICIMKNPSS